MLTVIFLVTVSGNFPAHAQPNRGSEAARPKAVDANGNRATSNLFGAMLVPARILAEGRRTTVVLDGWWSSSYAQASCETAMAGAADSAPDFQRARCAALDPRIAVRDFEDKLMKSLRGDGRCGQKTVARYNGPSETSIGVYQLMAAPHWSLALNFKPAALLQAWSLSNENGPYSQGESESLDRMASDICAAMLRAEHDAPVVEVRAHGNGTSSLSVLR